MESALDSQRVSVAVVTVDRYDEMRRLLPTLAAQTRPPDEVIVVDAVPSSALELELKKVLQGEGISVQYLTSERGICHQRNCAIEACTGDFIFFFDDDVELDVGYIEHAMDAFEEKSHPPVGGVCGTLLEPPMHPAWKRTLYHLLSLSHVGHGAPAVVYPNGDMRRCEDLPEVSPVPLLEGCRMAFRREVFEEERFLQYLPGYCRGEDGDFSARVARRWTLVQTPKACLRHHVSDSGRLVGEDIVYQRSFSRTRFFRCYIAGTPSAWPRFLGGMVGWAGLLVVRSLLSCNPWLLRGYVRGLVLGWRAGSTSP